MDSEYLSEYVHDGVCKIVFKLKDLGLLGLMSPLVNYFVKYLICLLRKNLLGSKRKAINIYS